MEQRAWSECEWRRVLERGTGKEEKSLPGAGPAGWVGEGSPLHMLAAALRSEPGFLNLPVLHNGGQSTRLAVPALKLTSVSPQACHIHLLSLRYSLSFQLQNCSGDQNQIQFNSINYPSIKNIFKNLKMIH